MKEMISKFPGTCCQCSKPIAKGTRIKWSRQRGALCTFCAYPETRQHAQRGPCWICKSPEGRFWSWGAFTPFWCPECHANEKAKEQARYQDAIKRGPDLTDMLYEDQCAAACGFGL
jgi:hypothetical protein